MNKYGITFKNGTGEIYQSEKDIEEFVEYLKSAEWVALTIFDGMKWKSESNHEAIEFDSTLVTMNDISSIYIL